MVPKRQAGRALASVFTTAWLVLMLTTGNALASRDEHDHDDEDDEYRHHTELRIETARWDADDSRLQIRGSGAEDEAILTLFDAGGGFAIGEGRARDDGEFRFSLSSPTAVPCRVRVETDSATAERDVHDAPDNCSGANDGANNGGTGDGGTGADLQGGGDPQNVSINSTSQSCGELVGGGVQPFCADLSVPEQPIGGTGGHRVVAVNDLGMHCGDLDTRVASILPPFQVLLAQVIARGSAGEAPRIVPPADVDLYYSAASNPIDPILLDPAAFTGVTDNGVYKTNFWDVISAYDAFYPPVVTPLAVPPGLGLPVPNVEELYIGHDGVVGSGDEGLVAVQHAMPGIGNPYVENLPQQVLEHYEHKPFFIDFPFGYIAEDVNWLEGAGIPLAAFDDFGRENPYPLVRVQAVPEGATPPFDGAGEAPYASVDTVLPISGEASCKNCHGSPLDVPDSPYAGAANQPLVDAELPVEDSTLDELAGSVPPSVSVEYAADVNILRLHDVKHGTQYRDSAGNATPCEGITPQTPNGDADCLANKALEQGEPTVCQTCHYTPALDLAQLGPLGGDADNPDPAANGRVQRIHASNSRVMHYSHGQTGVFPTMPAPMAQEDPRTGLPLNHQERIGLLEETCYQCHPGSRTKCLRGAMADGGMVCQDCHGGLMQVGDDFSAGLSAATPFPAGADLSKRVPWANEPGCGSCHTGDAADNLAGTNGTRTNGFDSAGNADGIRLIQAYRSGEAMPIVPSNGRFAEPRVPAAFENADGTTFANPGAGNPQLYRVSTGHGGVFCEGCHGATHAEWDIDGPAMLNDNVAANQLQGHSGTLSDCATCHGDGWEPNPGDALGGPHGMHVVGDTDFSDGGHENIAENNAEACFACHGGTGRGNSQGTVLSRAATHRTLSNEGELVQVARGEPVGCVLCHGGSGD
ncbi:hypothetical protein [uncultured Thiohalocapsa sp.]|uniref:hypothetical protein n=1 Tax=uncultured Thiohalocapsa sp. TaxID=768990 RepID=UPI0025D884C9|nr:hypothetical protein [uncultured Thiohalocapsa sp.]